jgi:hypothetical protein
MEEAALFDTTDIVLLAVIGLGTAAWFSRHQLKEIFGKKQAKSITTTTTTTTTAKRETNFVKVMEQQVITNTDKTSTQILNHRIGP